MIVEEAKIYRDTATFGKMDPFIHIFLNDKQFKTRVAVGGAQNPKWEEEFDVRPQRDTDQLEVKLFDDGFTGADAIGLCKIRVT